MSPHTRYQVGQHADTIMHKYKAAFNGTEAYVFRCPLDCANVLEQGGFSGLWVWDRAHLQRRVQVVSMLDISEFSLMENTSVSSVEGILYLILPLSNTF